MAVLTPILIRLVTIEVNCKMEDGSFVWYKASRIGCEMLWPGRIMLAMLLSIIALLDHELC